MVERDLAKVEVAGSKPVSRSSPSSGNNEPLASDVPDEPPSSAPAALRQLWPWVQRFGYSDDVAREDALNAASSDELLQLVAAVDQKTFQQINEYLDATDNSEEAVPYGDLPQAAMEAAIVLKDRVAT